MAEGCVFCSILAGTLPAHLVLDEPLVAAFLDDRPLFDGHALVVPRAHFETLTDLPGDLVGPLFTATQRLAAAVRQATGAEGTFVAMNNRVSQSVPHLHVHVVPRTKGDGLRGFFWPRHGYAAGDEERTAAAIRAVLADA
jgi:histidine triad (HIT) family protein